MERSLIPLCTYRFRYEPASNYYDTDCNATIGMEKILRRQAKVFQIMDFFLIYFTLPEGDESIQQYVDYTLLRVKQNVQNI